MAKPNKVKKKYYKTLSLEDKWFFYKNGEESLFVIIYHESVDLRIRLPKCVQVYMMK